MSVIKMRKRREIEKLTGDKALQNFIYREGTTKKPIYGIVFYIID